MDYIKMLKEIAYSYEVGTFQFCNKRWDGSWRVGNVNQSDIDVLAEASSPEEVIRIAHKILFPPIKKEYGVWVWSKTNVRWVVAPSHAASPSVERRGNSYWFQGAIPPRAADDFPLLRRANPDLKPPTEEEE